MTRLFRFLKPYMGEIFIILIFLFGQAMAELYLPTLMSEVVNNGMLKGDTRYILRFGSYMLAVALASSICAVISSFLAARVGIGFGRDVRNRVFTRVESYSLSEFDKIGTASLITRSTNDIVQVQTLLVMAMRFMIYAPIMCAGGIIMALSKDRSLSWVLVAILPIMLALIGLLAALVVPLYKSMQTKLDRVNRVLRENLTGIRVIRAFNRLEVENRRFHKANRDLTDTSIRVNEIMAAMQPLMIVMMNVTSIAIIWFGGVRISQNNMELGDMMAFLQYAMQIMFSIIMVTIMFVMVPRAEASAIRINEVLDLESDINDPKDYQETKHKRGYVEFKNVDFRYPGAAERALNSISFAAAPGEVTALIGGTGAGKSTLINLIPRFYDVEAGNVLVDGIDVREMPQSVLRKKIGFVPQKPILFSGSVLENLRYGRADASEEAALNALETAQAKDFVEAMSEGIYATISQGGTNLSGGQKQRLSIARALVRRPEIYVFDDSFSALDFKTDAALRKALRNEIQEATVILIAQRVSTVMDADRIIVLDEGRVVGMGTHRDLLSRCKVYREIVSSQLSEEEIA